MTATVAQILESVAADVSTPADERAIAAFLRLSSHLNPRVGQSGARIF